jgi:hypothetical protein
VKNVSVWVLFSTLWVANSFLVDQPWKYAELATAFTGPQPLKLSHMGVTGKTWHIHARRTRGTRYFSEITDVATHVNKDAVLHKVKRSLAT